MKPREHFWPLQSYGEFVKMNDIVLSVLKPSIINVFSNPSGNVSAITITI